MKPFVSYICLLSLIFLGSCDEKEHDLLINDYGSVLFYTDAQFLVNCGQFDIDVYINDSFAGKIKKPFLPIDSAPTCESENSDSVLKIKMNAGTYNYSANFYCSDKMQWSGNFDIKKDCCTKIFLDLNQTQE